MLEKKLADKLVGIAAKQLIEGLKAKQPRMKVISEIIDLYNNKVMKIEEGERNIPFPIMAGHIDLFYSKIDNPPTLTFKLPNRKLLSEKIQAAWTQESSSMRSGWRRKDRAEKKLALFSGRGVCKIYSSSLNNKYQSHYDVVDIFSFVADPTRGNIEEGNYHGEMDIFKTDAVLNKFADAGFYDKAQVAALIAASRENPSDANQDILQRKINRLNSLGIETSDLSFPGEKGTNLTEWVMRHEGEEYYILFDPKSKIWVRADKLKDVFDSGKTPFVSWATNYDEYAFWTKGLGDDIYPIAEAMRVILNNALTNELRRTRPMRIVDAGSLVDINELQDYVPDNVIIRNPGKDPNIVTVETPEITTSINLATFFDNMISTKTGVSDPGVDETDTKVGVFFGQLQQEADRIGTINKEYSESYAFKGYRFFWGLKQDLTATKAVEMLGKGGVRLQEISRVELSDVDDVDDVEVSGGAREEELNAVQNEKQKTAITELTNAYPDKLSADWVIKTTLKREGFVDEDIKDALDVQGVANRELMDEADEAIQQILLGHSPMLNNGATVAFMQRILDYANDNLNWVKLNKAGKETSVDRKKKKQFFELIAYMNAHQKVALENSSKDLRQIRADMESTQGAQSDINLEGGATTKFEQQQQIARPFEKPSGTPEGTAEASQVISNRLAG